MIDSGADIASGAIGGALGFLAAGPLGAAVAGAGGVAAASALKKIGNEVSERFLGPREQVRVGGTLALAAEHIRDRLERGERVRTDGFFENHRKGRNDAEEVAESVLLRSQREAEERKIPYMACLIGNMAFESAISAQLAHHIIKAAELMTYRQFCIMKLIAVRKNSPLRNSDYRNQGKLDRSLYEVLSECFDLYQRGFINFGGEVAFGLTDVKPGSMRLQGVGADIFNHMALATIPPADVMPIAEQLSD